MEEKERDPVKKVKITVVRKACYPDLMEKYENPMEHACDVAEGQVWIANGWERPEGLCESAWESMSPFVRALAQGGGNFYDGWMKDPKSAMISCNDGFRPFTFYIEAIEESEEQPAKPTTLPISKADERLYKLITTIGDKTMPRRQIIAYLDLKQRSRRNFMDNYLRPAIDKGYVVLAKPDSPNSPEQAYRLSANGLELLDNIRTENH